MDNLTESRLNMFRAVAKHCNDNPAIVSTVPAFQTAATALNSTISSILTTAQMESQVIKGITIDKSELKKTLCQQATDIAASVYAYASGINDNTLKQQVNYSLTELLRIKDDLIGPVNTNIHDAANTHLAALAPYGITAATLTSFMTAITNYITVVPTPRNAVSQRKAYIAELKKMMKDGDNILKEQMDKLIGNFKTTHPQFVTAYKSNRVIIDPATSGTQIKGKVISAADNKAIKDVKVEIVGSTVTDSTTATGRFLIKPAAAGTYSIKLTKPGFQEKTVTGIIVQLGQPSDAGTILMSA